MTPMVPLRVVVGLSGASGACYGIRVLEALRTLDVETHLILTRPAALTIGYETDRTVREVKTLATKVHDNADVGAGPASGSFRAIGMIVAPCSMRTVAEVACGLSTSLLTRAADVMLKERRRLVLAPRETPLHLGHLRNMATATELGAIIAPPMPAFYGKPATIADLVDHQVGRWLDLLGLDNDLVRRWREPVAEPSEGEAHGGG
ncbi:MAG: UbiX family flavin prenyltransferase [Pseudomonadota bacterium]